MAAISPSRPPSLRDGGARSIYLDWNATTPLCEEAIAAMSAAMKDAWANPASVHGQGRRARGAVESARHTVADLVGFDARDVVLTSGGTEANNLALRSLVGPGEGLVTSRLEHPSVVRSAEALETEGVIVRWIDPSSSGRVDPADVGRALDELGDRARLVSLQAVNHETGVVQPLIEVAGLLARRTRAAASAGSSRSPVLLHCDAVQAVGRLPSSAWAGADLVSVASHKLRGPKGAGALLTRPGIKLRNILKGGEQERGIRPGTQDPIAFAGFGAAALVAAGGADRYLAIAPLRDRLEAALTAMGAIPNGSGERAPHVTNLSFSGWLGPELCAALDLEGVCVSSGSACSAGTAEPSPIITAMLGRTRAASAVRISLGETSTNDDISAAILAFERVLART
ncbi:MAG: cysteine desulfurase [Polyangiaceae bacterium]|nr:cysteine desulfurase [Polyangiaceae bacterium]